MFITLALVVLVASIFVFFSQEFSTALKRLFAIKWAGIVLPVALASWLMFHYNSFLLSELLAYRDLLRQIIDAISQFLSLNEHGVKLIEILLLTVISVAPVFLLDFYLQRKSYHAYSYPYLTSSILWLVSALPLLAA